MRRNIGYVSVVYFNKCRNNYEVLTSTVNSIIAKSISGEVITLSLSDRWWKQDNYDDEHLPILFGVFPIASEECQDLYNAYKELRTDNKFIRGQSKEYYMNTLINVDEELRSRLIFSSKCDKSIHEGHFRQIIAMYKLKLNLETTIRNLEGHEEDIQRINTRMEEDLDEYKYIDATLVNFIFVIPRQVLRAYMRENSECIRKWWGLIFGNTFTDARYLSDKYLAYLILVAAFEDECLDINILIKAKSKEIRDAYKSLGIEPYIL